MVVGNIGRLGGGFVITGNGPANGFTNRPARFAAEPHTKGANPGTHQRAYSGSKHWYHRPDGGANRGPRRNTGGPSCRSPNN